MLAITYKKIMKIKVAEWGTPKKYLKKTLRYINSLFPTRLLMAPWAKSTSGSPRRAELLPLTSAAGTMSSWWATLFTELFLRHRSGAAETWVGSTAWQVAKGSATWLYPASPSRTLLWEPIKLTKWYFEFKIN